MCYRGSLVHAWFKFVFECCGHFTWEEDKKISNTPPSLASTFPLGFVHVSFRVVPEKPSPHYPPSPLVPVRLFLTSMSLVIFCLLFSFVDYVPVNGEIIWYLSLTTWLISLNIMLSSSIHGGGVRKGGEAYK